jgi:cbb3-type cytochrome oxidase subunit 1
VLMASGFAARVVTPATGTVILATGGTLSALGAYLFVYVIWRTIDGPSQLRAASERAARAVERSSTRGSRTLTVVAMQSGARHG